MDSDRYGSRRERSEESYRADSPEGALDDSEDYEKDKPRETSKHRSRDKKKSRREDKDHRSKDRDRLKIKDELKEREPDKDSEKERISIKEKKKEDKEYEKDRSKDKGKEKDNDRDKHKGKDDEKEREEKDRGRKGDRERERDIESESKRVREKDRGKDKGKEKEKEKEREKEKAKDRDRGKDREREKEKERNRDREREKDHEKNRDMLDREQVKDISREREREVDHEKERSKDKEKVGRRGRDDQDHSKDGRRDSKGIKDGNDNRERESFELGKNPFDDEGSRQVKHGDRAADSSVEPSRSKIDYAERISRMKEERLKKTSEGASEILSWVSKSRKLEEKRNSEKEKALRRSKILEEQDNVDEDDNQVDPTLADALAGVKVLHGVDKVLEGGAVVLTLKDQDILANGDLNEDVDMLENVEIGEQKRRSEAYKAAKKTAGVYVDKFNDEPGQERKMLPQYDDPAEEEGVVLDAAGRFTGEAEKKLEELRKRLQGSSVKIQAEDLSFSARISSDYYTPDEMLQFKKPKKKKSLRKKEKLDLDALEAEARSTGLGTSDLGSRSDNKRQAAKDEEERFDAERRKNAYQAAFEKADEASRALRVEQAVTSAKEEDDTVVFADDAEDLQKSLEKARKLALKKENEKALFGPEAVARASSALKKHPTDDEDSNIGDASDNKVVFTEMEEFVWGLQLDEEAQKPYEEDVFMEDDEAPKALEEKKDETGGWSEVVDSEMDEQPKAEDKEVVAPDEALHEVPVGKGLSGVLQLLKERGTLKETIEWGGRNMDKKKSKLVGIYDEDGPKKIQMDKTKGKLVDETPREIHLERTDEFGRILTPKQAFRLLSHKFHGKGPGKMKQEKRMKQYYDELKMKQMTHVTQSVDKMIQAQAERKTPYLVLSGNVKPGQTSDPRSGFATVEKEVPGSLTPMLGDRKVEHFLGIKRKAEPGSSGAPKKPKT